MTSEIYTDINVAFKDIEIGGQKDSTMGKESTCLVSNLPGFNPSTLYAPQVKKYIYQLKFIISDPDIARQKTERLLKKLAYFVYT